jgi:hemolysin-activating ACP:hemolysin acyltransferase
MKKGESKQPAREKNGQFKARNGSSNGAAGNSKDTSGESQFANGLDPVVVEKILQVRGKLQTSIAQVVVAMATVQRYRYMHLHEINDYVVEPLLRDRIAIATPKEDGESGLRKDAMAGIAIWATVSDDVDEKIRAQIKERVFPLKLAPNDWNSGTKTWLLDVIAPNKDVATSVLRNFAAFVQPGPMSLHPMVGRAVDIEALKKMGAAEVETAEEGADDKSAANGAERAAS